MHASLHARAPTFAAQLGTRLGLCGEWRQCRRVRIQKLRDGRKVEGKRLAHNPLNDTRSIDGGVSKAREETNLLVN